MISSIKDIMDGTTAQGRNGATAQRRNGATAQRPKGTTAQWRNGTMEECIIVNNLLIRFGFAFTPLSRCTVEP